MRLVELLASIGRLPPQAWDAIIPQWIGSHSHLSEVALNPQPLPPAEAFVVAAARMAHDVARLSIEAQVAGGTSPKFASALIDDWCGTYWPRYWPWPWPGPRPDEGPLPDPWLINQGRIVGSIVFASYGVRLGKGEMADVFLAGAERLAETAMDNAGFKSSD